MSKFLIILAGIGAIVVIAIAAVFFFTAGMVDKADEFFTHIKSNNYDQAYSLLSQDFQSNTSMNDLKAYISKNSLNNFKEASWESRSINGGRGTLTGSITTESGGVVPITLNFVKGESGWRIYSLQKPSSGIQEETAAIQIPTEQEQVQLVSTSMHVFAEAVNEKSMKKFHSHISHLWQKQFTVDRLDGAYGKLYSIDADLTVLDNYSPQFSSKATIDEDGVLLLAGRYPTKPNSVIFEQKYIYEGLGWKLLGFNISFK